MVHDESIYPDPEKFSPERFLNADGQLSADENILAFGFAFPFCNVHIYFMCLYVHRFGRRACVGRHAADATVWASIVSILSAFNITKDKDATGKEIEINPIYSDGLVR